MSMLKKRSISSARRTLLLVTAAVVFAVPCIAAAPYALHFNIEQPASPAATTAVAKPESAAPITAAVQPPTTESASAAAPVQQEQKPVTKMKTINVNGENVGVAFTTSEQEQSGGESAARLKRKLEEDSLAREERDLTPEQRAAREKMLVEKMALRTKMLSELSKAAKITMQQAIEAALRQQQGTVLESSLVGERRFLTRQPDGTFTENTMGGPNAMYRVVILSGDENAAVRTIVMVSAVDGTILRTAVE